MNATPISLDVQITTVKREIAMRERVYAKWVREGRMKADTAAMEIANMKAVLQTLMLVEQGWLHHD